MIRFCHERCIAFDVDDTLITQDMPKDQKHSDGISIDGDRYWRIHRHIEKLKDKFNQGFGIIVWSQFGDEWSDKVVKELGLDSYVHLAMTKPSECVDDLPISEWMKRTFIEEFKD